MKIWPLLVALTLTLMLTLTLSFQAQAGINDNANRYAMLNDDSEEDSEDEYEDDEYEDDEEDEFSDFYGDDDFVSIATGTKKPISKAPAVANVITASDIAKMGATHLDEVLERVPGLHVMISDLSRLDPQFSIRGVQGGFNPHVLILLNGVDVKEGFTGGLPHTFRFPVSNIERVEVIRGPGSAVYGADAFSGVINIITKGIDETTTVVGGRYGSFGSKDFWLNTAYKGDEFALRLAIDSMDSDGDDSRVAEGDLQTLFDGLFNTQVSQAPGPLSSHYHVLNVQADIEYKGFKLENWWWQQDKGGVGPGGAQALDNRGLQDVDEYRGVLSYGTDIGEQTSVKVKTFYQSLDLDTFLVLFPPGVGVPIGADGNIDFFTAAGFVFFPDGLIGRPIINGEDYGISATIENNSFTGHKLRASFGYTRKEVETREFKNFGPTVIDGTVGEISGALDDVSGTDAVFLPSSDRENQYISLQDEWQIANDLEFVVGVRYDDYSDFGSTVNPRMALIWQSSSKLTSKFLYGNAFRAPSFNEQFLVNNPTALGNPDLQPETIETFEIAFDYRPSFDSKLIASFFRYNADDVIILVADAPDNLGSTKTNQNALEQTGHGFELEAQWKVTPELTLRANYSQQISKSVDANSDVGDVIVPNAPKNLGYLSLDYDISDELSFNLTSHYVAKRKRAADDFRVPIKDYWLNNISFRYDPAEWPVIVSLSVKNLFEEDIFEPSDGSITNDFKMPSRQIWGQLEYHF